MKDVVTEACRALAHPARRTLLRGLAASECDVGHLSDTAGLEQPETSKHLAALRNAGLVDVRVDGRRRCYSLRHVDVVLPLLDLLDALQDRASDPTD